MNLRYLFIYILLILRLGYSFGSNDQSEMLPYSLYLHNQNLYPHDFYIQNTANHLPNERFIFSLFLSIFGRFLPWAVFLIHLIASLYLIKGMHRIARRYIIAEGLQYLGIIIMLLAFWGINPGDNELYYQELVPSYLSQILGTWAIVYYLEYRFQFSLLLLIPAALLHPLIGLQVFLFLSAAQFLGHWKIHRKLTVQKTKDYLKKHLPYLALFLFTGGIWILLITLQYSDSNISAQVYANIIRFRAPHHYFPQYFATKTYLLFLPLAAFGGWYYWQRKDKKVIYLLSMILMGMLAYSALLFLGRFELLGLQWFATAVWVKTFALLAIVSFSESMVQSKKYRLQLITRKFSGILLIAVAGFILYKSIGKTYNLPFYQTASDEIDICQLAKANSPTNALFLIPPTLSEFRYYSQRSSYIDYKAIVHQKSALVNWYSRIKQIYNIDQTLPQKGHQLSNLAHQNYLNLNETDILKLVSTTKNTTPSSGDIGYFLTTAAHHLRFPIIAQNKSYIIYTLQTK
jgi:hypothetical protein